MMRELKLFMLLLKKKSQFEFNNITKTKKKVPSCFSRMPQNKEINTNNKNTIEKATKLHTTRNTL